MPLSELLQETTAAIRARAPGFAPRVGVILGSGLGGFADELADPIVVPYSELPHFAPSSVPGHAGRLVLGSLRGEPVVALQGRVHFYEGFSPAQVVFPARAVCALGLRALVITNAAGGINPAYRPGDLMAITDHLNLAGWNPLVGPNDDRVGPRFPDVSAAYSPLLRALLFEGAIRRGVPLRQGVYACVSGPSYETPAEVRMLRSLGADAVGMSTVPEVLAATHMGVPVLGISCITNPAAGIGHKPLSHEEVAATASQARQVFTTLLSEFIPAAAQL